MNAGGSKAFSGERAVAMMKVLAGDGEEYKFGRGLVGEENPLRLTLEGLVYNGERGVVSLVEA